MSAVASRQRAKATPAAKAAPASFADQLQAAREQLRKADELLSQAWDATERGSTIDTILRHVIEDLLPDAVHMRLHEDQPTAAEVESVYQALFTPIGCLAGALQLADGTILWAPLLEAGKLLDGLQDMCSDAAPLATMAALQEIKFEAEDSGHAVTGTSDATQAQAARPAAAPESPRESNLDRSLRLPFSNAVATLDEAAAILRMYLDSVAEPAQGSLGLHRLMECTVSAANENEVAALWEIEAAERVQADMETVADLCSLVSEHDGGLVMEGTRALVQVACEALDRHVEILHQEREEAAC